MIILAILLIILGIGKLIAICYVMYDSEKYNLPEESKIPLAILSFESILQISVSWALLVWIYM